MFRLTIWQCRYLTVQICQNNCPEKWVLQRNTDLSEKPNSDTLNSNKPINPLVVRYVGQLRKESLREQRIKDKYPGVTGLSPLSLHKKGPKDRSDALLFRLYARCGCTLRLAMSSLCHRLAIHSRTGARDKPLSLNRPGKCLGVVRERII